jgi:hypothetical protein
LVAKGAKLAGGGGGAAGALTTAGVFATGVGGAGDMSAPESRRAVGSGASSGMGGGAGGAPPTEARGGITALTCVSEGRTSPGRAATPPSSAEPCDDESDGSNPNLAPAARSAAATASLGSACDW